MSLIITIIGYLLNSIAISADKFLITKSIPNPLTYVFYVNALSLIALSLLPFSTIPSVNAFTFASFSTIFWSIGAYLMFKALKNGNITRVIPSIGTITPLFLLFYYNLNQSLPLDQSLSTIILISGLIFVTMPSWIGKFKFSELMLEIFSGLFFALFFVYLKKAFMLSDFLSIFAYSKIIIIPFVLAVFFSPFLKKAILSHNAKNNIKTGSKMLFFAGQFCGGVAGLFLNYATSISNPTLIASLQGTQYIFLFIFEILLFQKFPKIFSFQFTFFNISTKLIGICLISFGLFILSKNGFVP